ncbi:pentapeptide repeat-containing protein [Streptomyces syringium]|uniref:pentapeptide repeat-containing protein n=1 Tax=Streptomyces syringium TaxID=76729 RepID=UPI003422F030
MRKPSTGTSHKGALGGRRHAIGARRIRKLPLHRAHLAAADLTGADLSGAYLNKEASSLGAKC